MKTVQVEYAGTIAVETGETPKELYSHQNEAIKALNEKNQLPFEGLLVLPTGGGKTLTVVHWLLRNFINKGKKVLYLYPSLREVNVICPLWQDISTIIH
ncbi:MAG: DEAD/DEAH box helicase family protein [Mojavia pulchra JT2-VF2]|jgi:superfamily II DNA or RNA helicase|uniref:DEAD/DEAH box helicase family protein n=1 Tax=Mojavia pulchra JT2-VF2 TaxID=287848 RepID=A0A951PYL9_9NOST|nr:DEAD/DEAH box helicase family protein [Mojavia pulchra JT2-VF2]